MWGKFDVKHHFPEMTGRKIVAYFTFENPKTLEMKVALSATSTEGALRNLHAETDGRDFDQLLAEAQKDGTVTIEKNIITGIEGKVFQLS